MSNPKSKFERRRVRPAATWKRSFPIIALACVLVVMTSVMLTTYESVGDTRTNMLAQASEALGITKSARVDTDSAGLVVKVAPGELLPISVKLSNFGGGKRVDVLVTYSILTSTGEEIHSTEETVAVETTANFVKTIQVPFGTTPGIYTAKTSIVYGGQLVPATTQFPFTVERKILGLFQSEMYLYGGIMLLVSAIVGVISHLWIRYRRTTRLVTIEYHDIPHDTRIFYEILSDTIMQMRERVGDEALDIAAKIDGLKIDTATGRVLALTEHPSKIIATLVSEYEKVLGKKVSFSLRK